MFRDFLPMLRRHGVASREREEAALTARDLFDELFSAPFKGFGLFGDERLLPAVDVRDEDKEVVVSAELPGVEPGEVDLRVERGVLTIRGEKRYERKEEKENYVRRECGYGSFYRAVPLPSPVLEDKAAAEYKNGVLTVRLPKDEKALPRKIEISS